MIEDSPDYEQRVQSIMKKINSIKGIFLQSQSIKDENRDIYTVTGEPILKEGEEFNGTCEKLTVEQKMFIEEEGRDGRSRTTWSLSFACSYR